MTFSFSMNANTSARPASLRSNASIAPKQPARRMRRGGGGRRAGAPAGPVGARAGVFGGGVHHEVRAEVERVDEVRRGERRVNHHLRVVAMSHFNQRGRVRRAGGGGWG